MAANTLQLDVTILGREYRVACAEDEQAELLEAVALLDARMREIRDKGRTGGVDRIAVMAALNIANELLRERKKPSRAAGRAIDAPVAQRRIRDMAEAIDKALASQDKLF
jgi:cell division protein ZapA